MGLEWLQAQPNLRCEVNIYLCGIVDRKRLGQLTSLLL